MPVNKQFLEKHLKTIFNHLPATIMLAGENYVCAVDTYSSAANIQMEGIFAAGSIAFICAKNDFDEQPEIGTEVIYNGEEFRVNEVQPGQDNVSLRLACVYKVQR